MKKAEDGEEPLCALREMFGGEKGKKDGRKRGKREWRKGERKREKVRKRSFLPFFANIKEMKEKPNSFFALSQNQLPVAQKGNYGKSSCRRGEISFD